MKKTFHFGLSTIEISETSDEYTISIDHNGNMGSSIDRVFSDIVRLSKNDSFSREKLLPFKVKEVGSPDYSYYFKAVIPKTRTEFKF